MIFSLLPVWVDSNRAGCHSTTGFRHARAEIKGSIYDRCADLPAQISWYSRFSRRQPCGGHLLPDRVGQFAIDEYWKRFGLCKGEGRSTSQTEYQTMYHIIGR